MSSETRQALVDSPNLKFQNDACRTDLLDEGLTDTYLIAALEYIVIERKWPFELTMVRSGHHDDGPHGHAGGFALDGWPLKSQTEGDWLDQNSTAFAQFLQDCSHAPMLYQIGLAGSAQTPTNFAAAGTTVFADDGEDHIHLGVHDESFG